jgi:tetratricopeptide (TPR) repeat protein
VAATYAEDLQTGTKCPLRPEIQQMTNEPKSNNQNKNQKRVIATLLILVAAVVIVLPNYVSEPWVTDASQTDFSSPSPAVSPSSAAEKTKYRQDAQSLLAEIINVRDRLNGQSVKRWGELEFRLALKGIEVGDEQYNYGDYQKAIETYQVSLDQMKDLESAVLPQKLLEAKKISLTAIESAGGDYDSELAINMADLATAIAPYDKEAKMLADRAGNLAKLMTLLAKGRDNSEENDLISAKAAYEEAVALDTQHLGAAAALLATKQSITEQNFRDHMSDGFAALNKLDFQGAVIAFNKAGAIHPNHPSVQQALNQVTTEQSQQLVDQQMIWAGKLAQQEKWHEALAIYQQLLLADNSLTEAKISTISISVRSTLDRKITKILDDPRSLAASRVFYRGTNLLADARGIINPGPRLRRQINQLDKVLDASQIPVTIIIQSDKLTQITVYKVADLGAFQETSISLKPGLYVAAGQRFGYRDVRVEFEVSAQTPMEAIVVICAEKV